MSAYSNTINVIMKSRIQASRTWFCKKLESKGACLLNYRLNFRILFYHYGGFDYEKVFIVSIIYWSINNIEWV